MCEACVNIKTYTANPKLNAIEPDYTHTQQAFRRVLLQQNSKYALHNRQTLDTNRVLCIQLVSAPGAGKTALLERSIDALRREYKIAVITSSQSGEPQHDVDTQTIASRGITVACAALNPCQQLDAYTIHPLLQKLELTDLDILFIENNGATPQAMEFGLGQHRTVNLLASSQGMEIPLKYPAAFQVADLIVISKSDLIPYMDYDLNQVRRYCRLHKPGIPVYALSAAHMDGLDQWVHWLRRQISAHRVALHTQNSQLACL